MNPEDNGRMWTLERCNSVLYCRPLALHVFHSVLTLPSLDAEGFARCFI